MNEHAPGWYEHEGERRYWDGQQWTHSASVPSIPPHDAPPPPPGPGQMVVHGQPGPYGQEGPYGGQAPPFAPGMMPPARKEPALSLLASFFVPGLGTMINGDVGTGAAFFITSLAAWIFFWCGLGIIIGILGLPVAVALWVWSMVHAYQGAVRYNQSVGYPS